MKTGWLQENELWYYFESSGAMAAAKVLTINGKQYELLNNGVMYDKERIISEAEKMPGVYKVVVRAVDGWMRVSYAEAELAVE